MISQVYITADTFSGGCIPNAAMLVGDVLYAGIEMNDYNGNSFNAKIVGYDIALNNVSNANVFTHTDKVEVAGIYGGTVLDVSYFNFSSMSRVSTVSGLNAQILNAIRTQSGYALHTSGALYHCDGTTTSLISSIPKYPSGIGCDVVDGLGAYSYCDGSTFVLRTLSGTPIKTCSAQFGGFVTIAGGKIYASYGTFDYETYVIVASLQGEIEREVLMEKDLFGMCQVHNNGSAITVTCYEEEYELQSVYLMPVDLSDCVMLNSNSKMWRPSFSFVTNDIVYYIYDSDQIVTVIETYENIYKAAEEHDVRLITSSVETANPTIEFSYTLDTSFSGFAHFKVRLYADIDNTDLISEYDTINNNALFSLDGNKFPSSGTTKRNGLVGLQCYCGPVKNIYTVINIGVKGAPS